MTGDEYMPQAQLPRLAHAAAAGKVALLYPGSAFRVVHPRDYLSFVT